MSNYTLKSSKRNLVKIGKQENQLFLLDENNKIIPSQISIEIKDRCNELPVAIVELYIDLDEIIIINE